MPEEHEIVSGEVAKVVEWKTGKGYFLGLLDNENDFYAFGSPKVKEGQRVTFEVAPGTGTFSDKIKLVKLLKELGLKEKVKFKAEEEVKEMEEVIAKGDKVYFDKQELIVKQCCIKAAAVIVDKLGVPGTKTEPMRIANTVIDIADRFFCYICRGEGPNEPLPEDE